MLKDERIVRAAGAQIEKAVNLVVRDLVEGTIEEEPDFSSQLAAEVKAAGRKLRPMGVSLGIKVFSSHGRGSDEKRFGADFGGSLKIDLPDYQIAKGFLAQAKLVRKGYDSTAEVLRLTEQCKKMLRLTHASFVFLYKSSGVYVAPAEQVVASGWSNLDQLFSTKLSRFYEQHIECFFGDVRLNAPASKLSGLLKNDTQILVRRRVHVSIGG